MIFRWAYVEIISGMEGKESCLTKQMWKWDGSQKGKLSGEEIALKINLFIIRDLEYFFFELDQTFWQKTTFNTRFG